MRPCNIVVLNMDVCHYVEMSSYLRSVDVYNHPVSTSFSSSDGDQAVQALSALNFTMTHNYGSSDIATMATQFVRKYYNNLFLLFLNAVSDNQETNDV